MANESLFGQSVPGPRVEWLKYIIMLLVVEKIVQHSAVTAAFYFNWSNIGATVAIHPRIFMVLGGIAALLFAFALWALLTRRAWARGLILGLAMFDMIGEFVAQGKVDINLNVSFLVAAILFLLSLRYREGRRPS